MSISAHFTLVILFISSDLFLVNCAKILAVFPTPSISHQVVFRPLCHELVRRGHEVTIVTTDPVFSKDHTLLNLTEIDVHDISYNMWTEAWVKKINTGVRSDLLSQVQIAFDILRTIVDLQFNVTELKNIIFNQQGQFNLLLIEAFIRPLLVLTHLLKIPTIQVSSFGGFQFNYESVGVSNHPFLYTLATDQRNYNLSKLEKLELLHNRWQFDKIFRELEEDDNEYLKNRFGQNIPTIKDLSENVDMLFLNIHPIWTDNQPVPPNVVHIRGIHNQQPKELPKELDTFLSASTNGVIYFSLGTNVIPSLMLNDKIEIFIKVFSELPYNIIWKWDLDTPPGKADNIKFYKWLPQSDLLRHPKIKLFITQGGLQSTDEAIEAGVPLIGIPMLGDQWLNVEKYVYHKIGVQLDMILLTENILRNAIETVISDNSYRENIIRLRNRMKDEPQTPLDRAVWWTEYVIRHGGAKHLRAAGANISWAQYLELELLATAAVVLLSALVVLLWTVYLLTKYISSVSKLTVKTKVS